MLNGMIEMSGGSASMLGYDVANQMDDIRTIMGVCPQHDVLFDDLTVYEHLEFFGKLKGIDQIISQLKGILAIGAFSFAFCLITFFVIKKVMGLCVSAEEEIEGLDIGEHGNEAYPDFSPVSK